VASLLTHPAVPLAIATALGSGHVGNRLLLCGCLATVIADVDVIAFAFGIPYASPFGHRGFTHSIAFALVLAVIAAVFAPRLHRSATTVFAFVLVAALSHPLLDAFTNGGLGVALAWPVSDARWFAPWRPIEVSPIGLDPFFSEWGVRVVYSELLVVWLPLATIAGCGWLWRRHRGRLTRP